MTLSVASLQLLARSAGWTGMDVYRAVAVALAESSGDPNATSANPDGGTNVGLWQLDTRGEGSGYTVRQLQDPLTNASVAWRGWHADGNTFRVHWSTANDGTAAARMVQASGGAATAADFSAQGISAGDIATALSGGLYPVVAGAASSAAGATSGVPVLGQLSKISEDLTTPAFWGRVALLLVGGALVVTGTVKLTQPVTAPVVRTVKKGAALAAAR